MTRLTPPPSGQLAQRALLRQFVDAAVAAAQPALCLPAHLPPPPKGRTVVIGAGKASAAMARVNESESNRGVRISAIVDTCFMLIADGVSEPSWTRRAAMGIFRPNGVNDRY